MTDYTEGASEAADGFDLTIQIGGLCMLVQDDRMKRLHVLMPASSGDHRHDPLVRYEDGKMRFDFPLGAQLNLTSLGNGNPVLDLPPGVLNLSEVIDQGVSRTLLETDPEGQVRCHAHLASGSVTGLSEGATWKIREVHGGDRIQKMATDVFWTIPLPGKSFPLGDFVTGGFDLFPRIDPVTHRPTVAIMLIDVPRHPYPHRDPRVGEEEHHFHLFYKLFERSLVNPPIPNYHEHRHPFSNPRCILTRASVDG